MPTDDDLPPDENDESTDGDGFQEGDADEWKDEVGDGEAVEGVGDHETQEGEEVGPSEMKQDEMNEPEAGIVGIDTTPKARRMIRQGLEALTAKHKQIQKLGNDLEEPGIVRANAMAVEYLHDLIGEYQEPGSDEARDRAQLALDGFEGPFTQEKFDMKGRP